MKYHLAAMTAVSTVTVIVLTGTLSAQRADVPRSHMILANPADVSGKRAESVYLAIRDAMRSHYLVSGDPVTGAYQTWRRYNRTPYRSGPHGELLVNNYANPAASGYGRYEKIGRLPPGATVVKDSFIVAESGDVQTGPLFLMEKREPGFNAASNDWLFMMVHPTGEIAGITNGENSAAVKFCANCHNKAPPNQDSLLLLPEEVRR